MRLMYTSPSSRAEGNTLPEGKEQQFTQTQVGLLGLGAYVPAAVLTNDDWAKYVDTSDEWITARTGIKRRHIAAEEECTADLALAAARRALDDARLPPEPVEEIIVASDNPEV